MQETGEGGVNGVGGGERRVGGERGGRSGYEAITSVEFGEIEPLHDEDIMSE